MLASTYDIQPGAIRVSFEPFDDFEASPAELARFAALLDEDPEKNLGERFEFFKRQDEHATEESLGFVPLIIENGFTCVGVPGEDEDKDLAFSVGFFYSFGFPEVMLLADAPGLGIEDLQPILMGAARSLIEEEEDEDELEDEALLQARAERLAEYVFDAIAERGLSTDAVASPDAAFLERYAYGYGWYFYRHFADTTQVPLLLARVTRP
jgi:hypothetical protein